LKEKEITTIIATHDSTDVLSFADEVIVLQEGKLIESGTPLTIYKTPKNKYIASLFGDVNEITVDGKIHYVYPHQFKITESISLEVEVITTYFRGSHFLIEANFKGQILFFENNNKLEIGTRLFLTIV
jgi:ABC-type sugar transport system ATPase subunit